MRAQTKQAMWINGRWQAARQADSPNCEERPAGEDISLVVLHNISLPPFEYGNGAVEKLFTNRIRAEEHPFFSILTPLRVSSHFFIERTGQVVQFVSCDQMAYHAGVSSFRGRDKCNALSIGIELQGMAITALKGMLEPRDHRLPFPLIVGMFNQIDPWIVLRKLM